MKESQYTGESPATWPAPARPGPGAHVGYALSVLARAVGHIPCGQISIVTGWFS